MKNSYKHFFTLILLYFVLILVSCKHSGKLLPKKYQKNSYATHFSIADFDNYTVLTVHEPMQNSKDFIYILSTQVDAIPDSLQSYPVIKIPVKSFAATSTTHLSPLELLGEGKRLKAFSNTNYISSAFFRKQIDQGKIKDIGNGMQINFEAVLDLHPELLMFFSGAVDKKNRQLLEQNNIPVFYNADWMESSPLGRAEWIKVFGLLFNKRALADSLFNQMVNKYQLISEKALQAEHPIVFQGGLFGDKWYVPGGNSYAVKLINDAGGKYVWQDDTHLGSVHLNYENVLLKLPVADVWLNPGMIENKQQLKNEISQAENFSCFRNNRIYSYNLIKGKTGGVLYFESSNMHPDWVLDDLFHIFNPDTETNYRYHYYQKLP